MNELHFNPGAPLNKMHCGSELALLSEDMQTIRDTHIREEKKHTHTPRTHAHLHTCDFQTHAHTHSVSVLHLPKVIKPNEALQGHAAFSVFSEMMRGFASRPQWNKRVEREGQNFF